MEELKEQREEDSKNVFALSYEYPLPSPQASEMFISMGQQV